MGPKSDDKCPYKTHREEGDVETETEIGVTWPQAKGAGSHHKLEEACSGFFPRASVVSGALPPS